MEADNDYVSLTTGQTVRKALLAGSNLFWSMLEAFSSDSDWAFQSHNDEQRKKGKQQMQRQRQKKKQNEIVQIPIPAAISGVMDDYVNFIDKDRLIPNIKAALKACSLIDDQNYLEFCVKRFLGNYSRCKDVLNGISEYHLEDIYLLMPKDLWPEQLQNSDRMLSRWLYKYYFSLPNWLTKHKSGGSSYLKKSIQFMVDDLIYVYVVRGTLYYNSFDVVVSVLEPQHVEEFVYKQMNDHNYEFPKTHYVTLKNNKVEQRVLESTSPAYILREITWSQDINQRVREVCYRLIDDYRFKQYKKDWYNIKHYTYPSPIIIDEADIDQYKYKDVMEEYKLSHFPNGTYRGHKLNLNVVASIIHYDDYGNELSSQLIMKDGSQVAKPKQDDTDGSSYDSDDQYLSDDYIHQHSSEFDE
jgi:hypothetical protein